MDFCNKITSPLEYIDKNGDPQTGYKFNAISRLVEIQKSLSSGTNKFVLFLTVHCSYDGEELRNFINYPETDEISD